MKPNRKPKITVDRNPRTIQTEGGRATWWRQHCMAMTRETLSGLIGYSVDSIRLYEEPKQKWERNVRAWQRYKQACERVHRSFNPDDARTFNWGIPIKGE